jgi:hypothetical protein
MSPAEQPRLMAGKYHYIKGGSSVSIATDTPIVEMVDLDDYVAVKIQGYDYGSVAVHNKKRILSKPRTRKVVVRKKPCHCSNFGFTQTEWMAGVPAYCKRVNNGGACELIKQRSNLFECNYEAAPVQAYIRLCSLTQIPVERIVITL